MFFKKFFVLLFLAILAASCTDKQIPDPQKVLPESEAKQKVGEKSIEDPNRKTNRYNEDQIAIRALIDEGSTASLLKAFDLVEQKVFSSEAEQKDFYVSKTFSGYVGLLVDLIRVSRTEAGEVAERAQTAEQEFYKRFLKGCLDGTEACDFLETSLSQESSVVNLMISIAKREKDVDKKLKLVGSAFDILKLATSRGRAFVHRKNKELEELYILTSLEYLDLYERGQLQAKKEDIRIVVANTINLSAGVDWLNLDSKNIERFNLIKPWLFERVSAKALNELRKDLIHYLPNYSRVSPEVKDGMSERLETKLMNLNKGLKDLSLYPAFSDIDLLSLNDGDMLASYMALELYFQNMDLATANLYLKNVRNKQKFMDSVFAAAKTLVRWDVAHLGLDSTEKLKDKFSEKPIKTNAFLQDTLNWAKTLVPAWNEFHTNRKWTVKQFLEDNIEESQSYNKNDSAEFFSAIDRTILKSIVYPNMMAFSYFMAKTEWKAVIRVFWFEFHLDSTLIMDYMVTGQYEGPWFNFTNLRNKSGWGMAAKESLFRSDIYDVLYYFFTTRTFETYGINADDFLKTVGETIFKKRRGLFEKSIYAQRQVYEADNTGSNVFVNWCEGIRSGNPVKEVIPYYELYEQITPTKIRLREMDDNGVLSVYYSDLYRHNGSFLERVNQTNDRYRLEFEPIFYTLSEFSLIAKNISEKHPELPLGSLIGYKNFLADLELLKMNYLGMQLAVSRKIADCLVVTMNESHRRAREVAFMQDKYFTEVVYPLMEKVSNGEISAEQANALISQFHSLDPKGVQDEIVASENNTPIYVLSKNTYMLRTAQFLQHGYDIDSELLGTSSLPAIVPSLEVSIPSNYLNDSKGNPYTNKGYHSFDYLKLSFSDSAKGFGTQAARLTTDHMKDEIGGGKITEWDLEHNKPLTEFFRYMVEFRAFVDQLVDFEYMDVFKPGCFTTDVSERKTSCIIKESADFKDTVNTTWKILDSYLLKEDDYRYFDLIGSQGWVGENEMHFILKHDVSTPHNYSDNSLPYQRVAGLFDFYYQMISTDYLGMTFETDWDTGQPPSRYGGGAMDADTSCRGLRDGCYWADERLKAREFFFARFKKPKLIFNYDTGIVERDFIYTRDLVLAKYNRLISLEKNAETYLSALKQEVNFDGVAAVSIHKAPVQLEALNINYRSNERIFEKFFVEELESQYLIEHDWSEYVVK